MPDHTVNCTSRKDGRDYIIHINAATQAEAEAKATRENHMVRPAAPAKPSPPSDLQSAPPTSPATLHADLLTLRLELSELHKTVQSARLYKSPISTIAWGVVAAFFLWLIVLFLIGIALSIAGISLQVLNR